MSDPLLENDDAATPLTPDERVGLIPSYITLRSELNEAEQANVLEGEAWLLGSRRRMARLLDEMTLKRLHKAMFGKVWRWAGKYRQTARNIGVEAYRVPMEMRTMLDDVRFWIEHGTFEGDEIAVRFHHRLVWIHAFPNGNGRHGRLAADALALRLGRPRFPWGRENLVDPGETRSRYVAALRAADNHEIAPLLAFSRS